MNTPENDKDAHVIYKNFSYEAANGEFTIIFTSKILLSNSKNSSHLSFEASYKVNWHKCLLIILAATWHQKIGFLFELLYLVFAFN